MPASLRVYVVKMRRLAWRTHARSFQFRNGSTEPVPSRFKSATILSRSKIRSFLWELV